MRVIDYGRSFVGSEGPYNAVRFWVDSRLRITDAAGREEEYVQCGACKSEHTFAEQDLFAEENYDFLPVFGPNSTVVFRQRASYVEDYRAIRSGMEAWGKPIYRLREVPGALLLDGNRAIREATHAGLPLVAQTEIKRPGDGQRAIIEYPVKTININDERDMYQVDTGPVLWPEPSAKGTPIPEILLPAFVAFNIPGFADFVIMAPTPVPGDGSESCRVYHYSRLETISCENRLYAIEEPQQ